MRPAVAGGPGNDAMAREGYSGGVIASVALHAALGTAIVFAPQIFKPVFRELPTIGPIIATIEGSGGLPRTGTGATRPQAVPLPETPPPPTKTLPAPPPPRPAPLDDLALPKPGRKLLPQKQKQVGKRDDLRPDFAPIRRQARPAPAAPPMPAPIGPPSVAPVPGPIASSPAPPGNGGPVDVTRKGPGGPGGDGTGVDPLLYYFARIQDKVSGYWSPAAQRGQSQALVGIRLMANGQVREITIESSSGDHSFDDAAVRALRQALPLPPFPAFVKESSMTLILRFSNTGVGG